MSEAEPMEPIEDAIRRLARGRPELGLETAGEFPSLDEVARGAQPLERWLEDTATLAAGIDRRTAAAYLMSILVWRWGEILGHLYLDGPPTLQLTAADLHAGLWVAGAGRSRDIGSDFGWRRRPQPRRCNATCSRLR